jgi:prepilin-type N-terminal cleavage/methylation domain-containing protein
MSSRRQRGVTLMEMMVVVALMGLLVGISFPSVTAGIESVRLASAADSVASYINAAVNWADRRQEAVEIEFNLTERKLNLRSSGPDFYRSLELPTGVEFLRILPEIPVERDVPRRFIVYPAGTVPQITVELENRKGGRRLVRVDPITGAPQIERPRDNQ